MDPISASGLISIGKEIFEQASSSVVKNDRALNADFATHMVSDQASTSKISDPRLRIEKLQTELKSDLLKDPNTANFFQQNSNCQIFLEKRADGSVQFISSSGQSLVIEKDSGHCLKANELLDLSLENKINLTAMRPNAVSFDS